MTWQSQGLCVGEDQEIWFPSNDTDAETAKQICRVCPVKSECRDFAIRHREPHGVWGGLSETDRRRLKRNGTTMLERRCTCCDRIFEFDSTAQKRLPRLCPSCIRFTPEGRRLRNTELKRAARQRARAMAEM